MEKRTTEPQIAQLVQSLNTSYILFTTVLGIQPEREPSLPGEWICSSLCIIDSFISFPFLPEHLLYSHTMPHVRDCGDKQISSYFPWSLQNNQPKNCRVGCCGECGGRGRQRASIKVCRAEERLGQVMRKGNCRPGPRKSMFKVQEVKTDLWKD